MKYQIAIHLLGSYGQEVVNTLDWQEDQQYRHLLSAVMRTADQ